MWIHCQGGSLYEAGRVREEASMKAQCPCHKCEHRYIACHSDCQEYEAWLIIHGEEKAQEK